MLASERAVEMRDSGVRVCSCEMHKNASCLMRTAEELQHSFSSRCDHVDAQLDAALAALT